MKKFISIILAVAMLFTMPGFMQLEKITEVQAADVVASADFTSGSYSGLNMEFEDSSNQNNENYTYSTSKAGVSGRLIPNNKYAYFKITNNAITQSDNNLFIEVTYYDEGNDFFEIQYNATSANYKAANITKSNSKQWVTTTVCIDDASFKRHKMVVMTLEYGEEEVQELLYLKLELQNSQ